MITKTVEIINFTKFTAKVEELNKKLKRSKKELVTFAKVGEAFCQINDYEKYVFTKGMEPKWYGIPVITIDIVEVYIPEMFTQVEGWEFIAKIEFLKAGNIVSTPGEAIEGIDYAKYATIQPFCHHCQARRPRQKSLVFRNTTTGEEIQIGTKCASTFFGVDLDKSIDTFEFLSNFWGSPTNFDDDWNEFGTRRKADHEDFVKVLVAALFLMKKYGFISKKAADAWMKTSTLDTAYQLAYPTPFNLSDLKSDHSEYFDLDVKEGLRSEIDTFINWAFEQELTSQSDFSRNALIAIQSSSNKHLGIVVAYLKNYVDAQNAVFEKKPTSEWIGEIGTKLSCDATVETIKDITNVYEKWLVKLVTDEGNQITWFASSRPDFSIQEGDLVTVSGKIKQHDEYKGVKSTIITRATLIKQ